MTSGRGWGARERLGALGVAVETEKDIVTILVSSELQDVMFDVVYRAADLDVPGRGPRVDRSPRQGGHLRSRGRP